MSSEISIIPQSYVKGPGSAFSRNQISQQSLETVEIKQKTLQIRLRDAILLLDMNHEAPTEDDDWVSRGKTSKCFYKFFKMRSHENLASPGRLKNTSEDLGILLKETREFFTRRNIQLILDRPGENMSGTCLTLSILVEEISLMPEEFFKGLKIKKLVVSSAARFLSFSEAKEDDQFTIDALDTEEKITKRFLKIVFDHLIAWKEDLLADWNMKQKIARLVGREIPWDLEEVFLATMKNSSQALVKPRMKSLQNLLAKYFPEEMTEEYFVQRVEMRKKLLRVQFNL